MKLTINVTVDEDATAGRTSVTVSSVVGGNLLACQGIVHSAALLRHPEIAMHQTIMDATGRLLKEMLK